MVKKLKNENTREEFYPSNSFRKKLIFILFPSYFIVTSPIILLLIFLNILGVNYINQELITNFKTIANIGYVIITILGIGLGILFINIYVKSISYKLDDKEILVKRGVITKKQTHVPFRTLTNISTQVGIFDRLFNIGTIVCETAGQSGGLYDEPEAKIAGIYNYLEIREIIMNKLRKFDVSTQYATTTELPKMEVESQKTFHDDSFHREFLQELKEIKEILNKK